MNEVQILNKCVPRKSLSGPEVASLPYPPCSTVPPSAPSGSPSREQLLTLGDGCTPGINPLISFSDSAPLTLRYVGVAAWQQIQPGFWTFPSCFYPQVRCRHLFALGFGFYCKSTATPIGMVYSSLLLFSPLDRRELL